MASYDNHADAHHASYPPTYDHSHVPANHDYDSQYRPTVRGRSRAPSSVGSDRHAPPSQQPLKNAIGNAFEKSDAARVVDPNLIAQITEQVKKSVLEEIKMSVAASVTQAQPAAQPYVPPSPASTTASVPTRDVYTPPSPKRAEHSAHASPSPDPLVRDPLLDGNHDTPTPRNERSAPVDIPIERPARPAPAVRMMTEDYTPIEKMWQRLFDTDGQPLPRLGEFLRGLALHLVEDYEPKRSLVITPAKMLKFYEEVKLPDETYPWQEQPHIPALTPEGFQEWMTAMIQAYPDVEYRRISKAVLDMPISNADDRKERFPKELPRRMFPFVENLHAQQRCAAALSSEGVGPLRRAPTFPPPPPPPKAQPTSTNTERERNPYASQPEPRSFSEDEIIEPSPSVPIERQRKPYAATPGGGKLYEDDLNRSATADAATQDQRKRRQSTAGQGPFAPPPAEPYGETQPRGGQQSNSRRTRSPSFSNHGTQSDPTVRDIPNSYYASNLHSYDDDARRYGKDADTKRRDQHYRSTAGTDSSYDSQTRSVYEDDECRSRHGSSGYDNRGYDSRRY
ncbi:hypothetical protein SNOG_07661 [Parastagonospora nodorum SN15]|uniref:DUF7514 domain-containing protein n=1 Tax=Phaeosphaeria nodorum (strain SN15 / ATCC MYA-4574 / FGSC 10173) TaxID=321614 RepID=Q0UKQ3_PHANO|nr:hypothetical protein SNOG_07661 [Parastagonospora nodorum SN15]EAT85127.2 hypothetical protein SNOG_07661 [Parastagonospora nodorum SN15]